MEVLTSKQVIERYKIPKTKLGKLVRSGELRAVLISRNKYLFDTKDIDAWLDSRKTELK